LGGSLSDEDFVAFLEHCRAELAGKQQGFLQRIRGLATWVYDMADCSLTVGQERYAMTPIGTHNSGRQTWLWAWANDRFPPAARDASCRLQALHQATGFSVFVEAGVPASAADAEDLAALAVHQLGAIGLFRVPANDVTLYLAVH
jgi:hypothetical protein